LIFVRIICFFFIVIFYSINGWLWIQRANFIYLLSYNLDFCSDLLYLFLFDESFLFLFFLTIRWILLSNNGKKINLYEMFLCVCIYTFISSDSCKNKFKVNTNVRYYQKEICRERSTSTLWNTRWKTLYCQSKN
jgi:hypothetical protein